MKKIVLFLLVLCLASQVCGCKGADADHQKENIKEEVSQEKETIKDETSPDASQVEGTGEEDSTQQAANATSNQNPNPTPAPIAPQQPAPIVPPAPPASSGQNTNTEAEFGSSEVVEVEKVEEVEVPKVDAEIITITTHKALSRDKYYQYNALSASEKAIYNAIYEGIKDCKTYVTLASYQCSKETLDKVYHAVTGDNPQFFYLTNLYAYSSAGQKVQQLILFYMDGTVADALENGSVKVNANRSTIAQQIDRFNNKIAEILEVIPKKASEVQKEKKIYDYLQDTITYDHKAAELVYSNAANASHAFDVYGAACENKAVCEGYAELFQYLCYCVGINATQVSGTALGGPHMWNAVCIDSEWYMLDATWDDCGIDGMHYYAYFNLTTSEITAMNHNADTTHSSVPTCASKKHAFYNDFALVVGSLTAPPTNYQEVLDYVADQKEKELCIYGKGSSEEMQSYLKKHIFSEKSEVQKYIKTKGYQISFESQYYFSGNYYYIRIK